MLKSLKLRLDSINEIALICSLASYHKKFTGYSLIKDLSTKLNKNISPSLIYPIIKRLESLNYVKKVGVGDRRKNFYSLTLKGRLFCNKTKYNFIALSKKITKLDIGTKIKTGNKKKKSRKSKTKKSRKEK